MILIFHSYHGSKSFKTLCILISDKVWFLNQRCNKAPERQFIVELNKVIKTLAVVHHVKQTISTTESQQLHSDHGLHQPLRQGLGRHLNARGQSMNTIIYIIHIYKFYKLTLVSQEASGFI